MTEYIPPSYPVLNFIATKGMGLAIALGAGLAAGGLMFAWSTQLWIAAPLAAVAGVLLAGLLASYVEVVRIIVDTLVPR